MMSKSDPLSNCVQKYLRSKLEGYKLVFISDVLRLPSVWSSGISQPAANAPLMATGGVQVKHPRFGKQCLMAEFRVPLDFIGTYIDTGNPSEVYQGLDVFIESLKAAPDQQPPKEPEAQIVGPDGEPPTLKIVKAEVTDAQPS